MFPIEQKAMNSGIIERIGNSRVIAVLIIDNPDDALPLGNALLEGGINTIELTLRTSGALKAASIIKQKLPEINLGIGTVLTVDQVKAISDIGADFAVAPGCNPRIIEAASNHNLSFAPGVSSPSDIEKALELGCRILKFFPAEPLGGMKNLKSMVGPYQYLNLKFIPLGGINTNIAKEYLNSELVIAIGGTWIAKRSLIQSADWNAISINAKEITNLVNQIHLTD